MHFNGLTDKQVEESRKKYGSNVIPDSVPTTFWAEFKETFKDPMIRILLAIAALMIVMCVLGYAEIYEPIGTVVAVLIVAFVSAKTGVASDTKYRQLKDSTKKDQCKVYRNGLVTVIDVDDVVVGDKVLLQSGDKIPADGVLYYRGYDVRDLEARALDAALILHADHGSNNSTFTNHVVTSSGTDTYSAIAASMASLKGPRHGGANSKVMAMMDDVKEHVRDWNDEGCVADYLTRILNKDAFDRSGLICGLGHAVYTKTDPRCEVFRAYVNHLAAEKGREDELALYANVEKIGKQLLMERQHKSVLSTNIDFYSGFVYEMLGLPKELYTPLFAVARIAGWSAHRMEELSVGGKLIRPRYECVEEHRPYTSMDRR